MKKMQNALMGLLKFVLGKKKGRKEGRKLCNSSAKRLLGEMADFRPGAGNV